jgi:uncharacterized membrane protein YidH (DUF202 family)
MMIGVSFLFDLVASSCVTRKGEEGNRTTISVTLVVVGLSSGTAGILAVSDWVDLATTRKRTAQSERTAGILARPSLDEWEK